MSKFDCEMFKKNKCLGCVGLGEKNWAGKYQCEEYKKLVRIENTTHPPKNFFS